MRKLSLLAALAAALLPVHAQVVISQVYGGGGNSGATLRQDFVELFNRGTSAQDLTGWSLQYTSAAGTNWGSATNLRVNLSGSIPAGGYYLIRLAQGTGGTQDTPAPDATGTIAASATSGKFALVNATANLTQVSCPTDTSIVDLVGYGTANCFEGAAAAPALTNTSAALRGGNGCTDTNNNQADFTAAAPSPRNSLSPLNGCTAPPLSITTSSPLPNATVGALYSQTIQATGGAGGYTFSVASGSTLPANFTLSAAGLLSGTAQSAFANATFSVTATDTATASVTKQFQLTATAPACNVTQTISQIQGAGDVSPFAGQVVTTRGIVTARRSNGFYLQSATGDGDANTSDGIFVFIGSPVPANAAAGNELCVSGTVQEFQGANTPAGTPTSTQLSNNPTLTVLASNQPLPAPVLFTTTNPDPAGPKNQLEKYEGMRVQVNSMTVVQPTDGAVNEANATGSSNGVFWGVVTGVARPFREPGVEAPYALPKPGIARFDGNPELIRVDSDGQPGTSALNVTSFATVTNLIGPLDGGGFNNVTLYPDAGTGTTVSGNVAATPVPAVNSGEVSVASFNMERFFDDQANGNPNGSFAAPPTLTATAFSNRIAKAVLTIRDVLRLPDVIGLQEVERATTAQALASALNAATGANYQSYLIAGNDVGGINVAALVNTNRVTVTEVVQVGKDAEYTTPSGTTAILNDRPSLVVRGTATAPGSTVGLSFTVIVNHLRSLNDIDDPAEGPRVRAKRAAQAEFLASYIQTRQAANPAERIIVLGDLNAFQFNDGFVDTLGTIQGTPAPASEVTLPTAALVNPTLTNFVNTFPVAQRYSYIFNGSAQFLDHILGNVPAAQRFVRIAAGRSNADFPETLRADATRPERLSDHDPLVAYFRLPQVVSLAGSVRVVSSGLSFSPITRTFNGTITVTNTSGAPLTGPFAIRLTGLPTGVILANAAGTFDGTPFVTSALGSLAPGASFSVPVRFLNPGLVPITATPVVFSGTF